MNLYGAPPLKGKDYQEYRKFVYDSETVIGAGFTVVAPTGDCKDDKLINIGSNRYTFRPQIGIVHNRGKWSYETTLSAWIYTKTMSSGTAMN